MSVEGSKVVGVRKDSLQKKLDYLGLGGLRVAGKIVINSNENMFGTCDSTKCRRHWME